MQEERGCLGALGWSWLLPVVMGSVERLIAAIRRAEVYKGIELIDGCWALRQAWGQFSCLVGFMWAQSQILQAVATMALIMRGACELWRSEGWKGNHVDVAWSGPRLCLWRVEVRA